MAYSIQKYSNTLEITYININFVENHEELWLVTWSTKSFSRATDDQHFFDGSNARWVGLHRVKCPTMWSWTVVKCPGLPGGGGDDRAWNWLIHYCTMKFQLNATKAARGSYYSRCFRPGSAWDFLQGKWFIRNISGYNDEIETKRRVW